MSDNRDAYRRILRVNESLATTVVQVNHTLERVRDAIDAGDFDYARKIIVEHMDGEG